MKRKVLKRIVVTIMAMTMVTTQLPVDTLAASVVQMQNKQQNDVDENVQDEIAADDVDSEEQDYQGYFVYPDEEPIKYEYLDVEDIDNAGEDSVSENALDNQDIESGSVTGKTVKEDLDAKYDSRQYGYITEATENQRFTGTCWAHASIAAIEANMIKNGLCDKSVDLSEQHLIWYGLGAGTTDKTDPLYGDNPNIGLDCYKKGSNQLVSQRALVSGIGALYENEYGLPDITTWPLTSYESSKGTITKDEAIESYGDLSNFDDVRYKSRAIVTDSSCFNIGIIRNNASEEDIYRAKKEIMEKGAITATYYEREKYHTDLFNATDAFDSYYNSEFTVEGEEYTTNHEVIIVGWDDNYDVKNFDALPKKYSQSVIIIIDGEAEEIIEGSAPLPKANGAWLCKNSHSSDRNENGYFYMSYYDTSLTTAMSFGVSERSKYGEKIYQYAGSSNGAMGVYKNPVKMKNIACYKAEGQTQLSAVGFDTSVYDTEYEVYIYTDIKNPEENPEGETVLYKSSGVISNPGYHVIDLDKIVEIEDGKDFSILVYNKTGVKYEIYDSQCSGKTFSKQISGGIEGNYYKSEKFDINIKAYTASNAKKLSSIEQLEDVEIINVNGRLSYDEILEQLPKTVEIITEDNEKMFAEVRWCSINHDYTEKSKDTSSFVVSGSVLLPENVVANGKILSTKINVTSRFRNDLVWVDSPDDYVFKSGTSLEDILKTLPQEVPIVTELGVKDYYTAEVKWDTTFFEDVYDPESTELQRIVIFGDITLPKTVTNTNKVTEGAVLFVHIKPLDDFHIDCKLVKNTADPKHPILEIAASEKSDVRVRVTNDYNANIETVTFNTSGKYEGLVCTVTELEYTVKVTATLRGSEKKVIQKFNVITDGTDPDNMIAYIVDDNEVVIPSNYVPGDTDNTTDSKYITYIDGKPYFCNLPVAKEPGKEFVCWTYGDKEIHNGDDASWVNGDIKLDPKWSDITLWTGQQYDVTDVYKDIIAANPDAKYRVKTNNKKAKVSSKNGKYIITAKSAGTVEARLQCKDGKKWKDVDASTVTIQISKAKGNVKTIDRNANASIKVTDIIGQLPSELYNSIEISCVNPKKKTVIEYNSETGMVTALEKGKASIVVKLTRDDVTKVYKFKIKVK